TRRHVTPDPASAPHLAATPLGRAPAQLLRVLVLPAPRRHPGSASPVLPSCSRSQGSPAIPQPQPLRAPPPASTGPTPRSNRAHTLHDARARTVRPEGQAASLLYLHRLQASVHSRRHSIISAGVRTTPYFKGFPWPRQAAR